MSVSMSCIPAALPAAFARSRRSSAFHAGWKKQVSNMRRMETTSESMEKWTSGAASVSAAGQRPWGFSRMVQNPVLLPFRA